jgi:uncharacterized protein YraI
MKINKIVFSAVAVMALILGACSPTPTPLPTQDVSAVQTQAVLDAYAELTASAPTPTPLPPEPELDNSLPVAVVPQAVSGQPSATVVYSAAIMSGPGKDYVLYGVLLAGRTVQVTGVSEDGLWWVINVPPAPNGQGWVSAAYLTVTGAETVAVVPTPPVPPTTEMIPPAEGDPQATALVNVYVRSGPGTYYPAYGIAPSQTTGRVIGVSQDKLWWVVRVDPTKVGLGYGWVAAQYTTASNTENLPTIKNPIPADSITPVPPPAGVPYAVATDYVNVRSGPGTTYPILGVAPPGASAEVTGISADGGWWQVKIPAVSTSNGFAWVSAGYVVTTDTGSVPVVAAPYPPPVVEATPVPPATTTSCQLVSQNPVDGTTYTIGTPFTASWILRNTGTTEWDTNFYDVRFAGALNNVGMHTGPDLYDLGYSVDAGQEYNVTVPMMAPTYMGTYAEAWEVVGQDSSVLCYFYVYINVP